MTISSEPMERVNMSMKDLLTVLVPCLSISKHCFWWTVLKDIKLTICIVLLHSYCNIAFV